LALTGAQSVDVHYLTKGSKPIMAVTINAAQQQAALDSASSDLKFLLSKEGVSVLNQAKLFHIGIVNISLFVTFARDEDDLRDVLKTNLELNPAARLADRVQVASVVCAFHSAKIRKEKLSEVEAELESRQWQRPLPKSDFLAMRVAFETKFWRLEDKMIPGKDYLERKLEDLESGEWRAEALSEVVSKDELEPDVLTPVWDPTGKLTVKKQSSTVPLPSNPEELRRRIHLLGTGLIMLGMRHTNRQELADLNPGEFHRYLDYLLGDHCYNMVAKSSEGYTIAAPPWALIVSYEHALRKKAMQFLNEGSSTTFVDALKRAVSDTVVKERYFTTPLALSASRPRTEYSKPQENQPFKDRFNKDRFSKGGKGGKGRNKGGKGSAKGSSKTPEGKPICFRFNNPQGGCRNKKCKYQHVCNLCFGKSHPSFQCRGKQGAPDTNGLPA
jgi:hypothetical protein